jgi:hypothetical protein
MLTQSKIQCDRCATPLTPDDPGAVACSHQCTFCAPCNDTHLHGTCPNCSDALTPRLPPAPAVFTFPGASASSSARDFDFLAGRWTVHNRKLRQRLANCQDWDEFPSTLTMAPALLGLANVEHYAAQFGGRPFEGMAVRLFDPGTRLWSVYWMDSSGPVMDSHPVVGSFDQGVGRLYSRGELAGRPIVVLYQWDARDPYAPLWSQAFSADDGRSWEWNWYMHLKRAP